MSNRQNKDLYDDIKIPIPKRPGHEEKCAVSRIIKWFTKQIQWVI